MALVLLLLLGQFGSALFPDSPGTEGDAALQEEVERLLEQKLDINRSSGRDLLAIPWLNPALAFRVVAVRESAGAYRSEDQLHGVPGMTAEVLEALRPFLRVGSNRPGWAGGVIVRAETDSVGDGASGLRLLNRFEFQSTNVFVTALQEKDKRESDLSDFISAGAECRIGHVRLLVGDVTAGFGQGLVASAPHWRSSLLDGPGREGRSIRLVSSAVEGSYLRGGAVEGSSGNWRGCLLGAYTGRDAKLNCDGSVDRLVGSGVHDDSASVAGRRAVHEATAGLNLRYTGNRTGVGFAAEYSKYTRRFAPSDSAASFAGDEVLVAGANAGWKTGHYELSAEVAGSSGKGLAGSFQMDGSWPEFDSRVAIRGRQARFFAPHGRWASLTNARDRLDTSGRLGWHHAGSSVSVSGNTYRDYELDSMPARLELRLGQELGRFDVALGTGLRYRLDEERSRTARAEAGARVGTATAVRLMLADVYPMRIDSRGAAASVLLTQGLGTADLGLAASRVSIDGSGVTMYLHEPGVGRIGASLSASASCWRLAAGCGMRVGRWLRLGIRTGCTWQPRATFDAAAQLELHRS